MKASCHNFCAYPLELASRNCWSLRALEPMLCNKRTRCSERPARHHRRVATCREKPALPQRSSAAKKHINKNRLKTESRGAVLEADFHTWRRRPHDLYFFIRATTEENHWWFPFLVLHAYPTRLSWHSCSQNVMTFYKIIPISFFFFGYAMWHVRS